MADQRRVFKIAEKIREVISRELLHVADPRLSLVSITSVIVAADLRHAKVYWSVLGDSSRAEETDQAFKRAAGHFRSVVGKALEMRFAPTLVFFYDDTLDTVEEVNALLKRAERQAGE